MDNWKTGILLALVIVVLLLLYPARQLGSSHDAKDVVEIVYMGPNTGSSLDALREFESWSRERHARDPRQPIYRVIPGQSAASDMVSDPTRFLLAEAGGSPPDVIYFDRYAVSEWAARGAFMPLDHFITQDVANKQSDPPPPTQDRFYAPCWNEARYQGHQYAIPDGVDDRGLFYNKDLLIRAGLVDAHGQAKPPATWEELHDDALKLTEYDKHHNITTIGFIPNYGNSWLYMYSWLNGGEFISADGMRCTLNAPRNVEALQYMKRLYDDLGGYETVQGFQSGFQGNELDPFIQGKVAMKIDGAWSVSSLATYGKDVNFGMAPPPISSAEIARLKAEGKPPLISWCGGWSYAIPTHAHHKEAAWELIRFLTSEPALRTMARVNKDLADAHGQLYCPLQNAQWAINDKLYGEYVFNNPQMPEKFKAAYRVLNDLIPYSRYRPVTPVGQLLWNEHVNAMENALYQQRSGMDPQQALDAGTRNVQRDLDMFFHPPAGRHIHSWNWFFLCYAMLIIAAAVIVFAWDTKVGFRRRLARLFGGAHRDTGGVVEGAHGGYFRKQWWEGFLCALPWIVGFLVFGGGPMLFSFSSVSAITTSSTRRRSSGCTTTR